MVEISDLTSRYIASKDRLLQKFTSDSRKPKLTLMHLNLLKKMRASKRLEILKRKDTLKAIYGSNDSGQSGGF